MNLTDSALAIHSVYLIYPSLSDIHYLDSTVVTQPSCIEITIAINHILLYVLLFGHHPADININHFAPGGEL